MGKVQVTTSLVEVDGDEMTRVLWQQIEDELFLPYADLKTEYYDLGLPEWERTKGQVTVDSAEATKKYGMAVKCAVITPNAQRVEEHRLSQTWKSPNGTARAILDDTVFRAPIMIRGISPVVKIQKHPITIAHHVYDDAYRCTEYRVPGPGRVELVFVGANGKEEFRQTVYDFECSGVLQGQYNKDSSIASFARSCFQYAIDTKQGLWFAIKDTTLKQYDHAFKDISRVIFNAEYKAVFDALGVEHFYTFIDGTVARVIHSQGDFIWAYKNYDGDVMNDMVSTAFGSLAMMTSALMSPDGKCEYKAAHGTVIRYYYKYLKGEETSTNLVTTFFVRTDALHKQGEPNGIDALGQLIDKLEVAIIATIEGGTMAKDLVDLWDGETPARGITSLELVRAIRTELEKML